VDAKEEEDDQEILGKEIWRGKCGQWASGLAGGRWKWQHKTALGDEWSVAYAALGATRHKSSKSQHSGIRHTPDKLHSLAEGTEAC